MESSSSFQKKNRQQTENSEQRRIPINQIYPNKYQPRKTIANPIIRSFADSIKQKGDVDDPIIVVQRPSKEGKYMLIDGECRWRGCRHLELKYVKATVYFHLSDLEILAMTLRTFTMKNDIHILDKAAGIRRMMDEFGLSVSEAASQVGYSAAYTGAILKLLNLHSEIQEKFRKNEVKIKLAQELASYSPEEQLALLAKCAQEEKRNHGKPLSTEGACHLVRRTAETRRMKKQSSNAKGRESLSAAQLTVNSVCNAIDTLSQSLIRLGELPAGELNKIKNPFPNELATELTNLMRMIDIRVKKLRSL